MDKATDSKNSISPFPSIYRTIRLSFAVITLALFGLFWSVIYVAEYQLEVISLHHWLDTEASAYSRTYQQLGEATLSPNENEFTTYWSEKELPNWLS